LYFRDGHNSTTIGYVYPRREDDAHFYTPVFLKIIIFRCPFAFRIIISTIFIGLLEISSTADRSTRLTAPKNAL